MSFYLVASFNKNGVYSGKELLFFNNEVEKSEFSKKYFEINGEEVFFYKPKSLKEAIAVIDFDSGLCFSVGDIICKEISEIYDDIVVKFGLDLINKNFPEEQVNNEFFNSIQELSDKMLQELHDEENGNYAENERTDYGKSDDEISYDEETTRWDEETDGSWRIENDFG